MLYILGDYYALFSGIGEYIGIASICLDVHPRAYLHDGWVELLHIGYQEQVLWANDAPKIEFCSVPNLNNYGHFFINLECCDIPEKNMVILFIFGTVTRYHACKLDLPLCQV